MDHRFTRLMALIMIIFLFGTAFAVATHAPDGGAKSDAGSRMPAGNPGTPEPAGFRDLPNKQMGNVGPGREVQSGTSDRSIMVDLLLPNEVITSPTVVTGSVRGGWFSEGEFPIVLKDANGNLLGSASAHAEGDWMGVEGPVKFEAHITFERATTGTGVLVFTRSYQKEGEANVSDFVLPVRLK